MFKRHSYLLLLCPIPCFGEVKTTGSNDLSYQKKCSESELDMSCGEGLSDSNRDSAEGSARRLSDKRSGRRSSEENVKGQSTDSKMSYVVNPDGKLYLLIQASHIRNINHSSPHDSELISRCATLVCKVVVDCSTKSVMCCVARIVQHLKISFIYGQISSSVFDCRGILLSPFLT